MNRKQRRELTRKIQSQDLSLEVVHPDAAGIDIGNESHYVAVPSTRDSQPVRRFGCTTGELKAMAEWLKQCRIRTVAMQSTGVYGVAVYDILEQAGLEVYLVNARDTKNLPGRKSDVQESQWLMKLHTYGLLRNSFRPSQEIRMMRTYWRQRNDLVQSAGRHIQRMQEALTQMNIQLAKQVNEVTGFAQKIELAYQACSDYFRFARYRCPASGQLGWTLQITVYDRVGGAVSKSQKSKRRMCRRILRNRRCTQDKQVRDLPMLQVRVDDRTVGRTPHDGSTLNVSHLVTVGVVIFQARE